MELRRTALCVGGGGRGHGPETVMRRRGTLDADLCIVLNVGVLEVVMMLLS